MMKPPRSLKSRALQLLSQREQSRAELRRKLLTHAKADDARAAAEHTSGALDADSDQSPDRSLDQALDQALDRVLHRVPDQAPNDAATRVDAVLVWLEANNFLSDARFAESRVHARASRFGNLRIRQELKQHAVALTPEASLALKNSELARAISICERRYDAPPQTQAERAKRSRFLSGRGFSPDTIQRAMRSSSGAESDADGAGSREPSDD